MTTEPPRPLVALLAERAARAPDAVALAVGGGASLTYGEWERRSTAMAVGLLGRGVAPGDRVVLHFDVPAWADHGAAYAAVLKAGAVAVPVDPRAGPLSLRAVVADCGARGVLTGATRPAPLTGVWTVEPAELLAAAAEGRTAAHLPVAAATEEAELRYEAFPLARPTGLSRSHASLAAELALIAGALDAGPAGAAPGPALLPASPVASELSRAALWLALLGRWRPVTVCGTADPDEVCSLLATPGVGACALTPPLARVLVESGALERHHLAGLRQVVVGPAAPPGRVLARLAGGLPSASLVTLLRPRGSATAAVFVHDRRRPAALGCPAAGTRVRGENGAGDASGHGASTLWVASPVHQEEAAAGAGHVDSSGAVHLVEATARLVVHARGRVVATEVEDVLSAHPAVSDVAVLGLPHDHDAERVVAAVSLRPGLAGRPPDDLVARVRRQLGEEGVPWQVMVVDEVDRNPRGVLLQSRLRRRLGAPAHAPAPRPPDRVEETVAAAWEIVLGAAPTGPGDDFFEAGGDEVAATRLLSLVEDGAGARVALTTFLASPSVAGLASALRAGGSTGRPPSDVPVAFSQEGMLWHEHFAPGCQNLPALARRFRGPLDVAALERALGEVVRRHEPLRTNFALVDGRPVQVVHDAAPFRLPVRDLGHLGPAERQVAVERTLADQGSQPFHLGVDPLFAPLLLRLAADDHVLVLRVHHTVYDDWSVGVFRQELSALYGAFAAGEDLDLPDLPVSFGDAVREQRRSMAGGAGAAQLSYWRARLTGGPFTTQLPVDDPDLPEGTPQRAPDPVSLGIEPDLHRGVRELARRRRTTVFTVLLAAFQALTHRLTGQDDILVASVVANRNRTELERLVGCFTKKVPLRLRLHDGATFAEVLAEARSALLGALAHQDLPFETLLQEALGGAAATHGLVPHVATMFQGVTPRGGGPVLPGVESTGFETSARSPRAHFMAAAGAGETPPTAVTPPGAAGPVWGGGLYLGTFVILSVIETADELTCQARGAFHPPAVERLLRSYRALLADAVARPDTPVGELTLGDDEPPAAWHRRAVHQAGGEEADPPPTSAAAAHAAATARAPDAPAVVDGDRRLTHGRLQDWAGDVAGRLRGAGIEPGTPVGVCLRPSAELVVAVLGIWLAGAVVVTLDPDADDDRQAAVVADAGVAVVVAAGPGPGPGGATVVEVGPGADATGTPRPAQPAAVPAGGPAVRFYGAGAQAAPGGVVVPHSCLVSLPSRLSGVLAADTPRPARTCLSATTTHDGFWRQLAGVLDGGTVHVTERIARNPRATLDLLARASVDVVHCTPAELHALVEAGVGRAVAGRPPGAAPAAVVVGTHAPLPPHTWDAASGLGRDVARVVYGPPECSFAATGGAVEGCRPTVGAPLGDLAVSVRDRHGRAVPVQVVGDLHVEGDGAGLAGGVPGQRARLLPDGSVELLGSAAAFCDLGGFRVSVAGMEAALADSPLVQEVAVVDRGERPGPPFLVAYVVPRAGSAPGLVPLREHLWRRAPGYAWPAALVLVPSLPRLPSGRVDADALPHPVTEKAPGRRAAAGAEGLLLAAAWADALGVRDVAVDESYWQRFSFLGLLSSPHLGASVPGHLVTRARTVEALGAALAAERGRAGSA